MKKKGFTLVELLAVIVLLGIIATIAVASFTGISRSMKKNILEEKIKMIEESAIVMGSDIKGYILESNLKYNNNKCRSIIVSDLVPNYLVKDNDNECLTNTSSNPGCIIDPTDENNYLDTTEVIIYYKNKRIYAKVDIDDKLTCK